MKIRALFFLGLLAPTLSVAASVTFTNEHNFYKRGTVLEGGCSTSQSAPPANPSPNVCYLNDLPNGDFSKFQCCGNPFKSGCQVIDYHDGHGRIFNPERTYFANCTPSSTPHFENTSSQYGPAYIIYLAEDSSDPTARPTVKGCVLPPDSTTTIPDFYSPPFFPPPGPTTVYALSGASSQPNEGFGSIGIYIWPNGGGISSPTWQQLAFIPLGSPTVEGIPSPSPDELGYNLCPGVSE